MLRKGKARTALSRTCSMGTSTTMRPGPVGARRAAGTILDIEHALECRIGPEPPGSFDQVLERLTAGLSL